MVPVSRKQSLPQSATLIVSQIHTFAASATTSAGDTYCDCEPEGWVLDFLVSPPPSQ